MPYSSTQELPPEVKKKYTSKQLRAFRQAFNSAVSDGKSESVAFQIAHAAARRAGSRDATQQKVGYKSKPRSQKKGPGRSDRALSEGVQAMTVVANATSIELARTFSADQRKKLAQKGHAMPDGSFPIANEQDLRNAIRLAGNAANPAKAKAHIKKRARALGKTNLIPDSWKGGSDKAMDTHLLDCPDCDRAGFTQDALDDHAAAVHTHNDIRTSIQKKLREQYPLGTYPSRYAYVRDVSDDWFVYELEENRPGGGYTTRLYKQGYSFKDGVATFKGTATEVREQMTYVPVPQES